MERFQRILFEQMPKTAISNSSTIFFPAIFTGLLKTPLVKINFGCMLPEYTI